MSIAPTTKNSALPLVGAKSQGNRAVTEPAGTSIPLGERAAGTRATKSLRGDRNQCAACGEYFNSSSAFDKHRIGEFGRDRGCASWFGMAHIGMHLGTDGFWRGSKMPAVILQQVAA